MMIAWKDKNRKLQESRKQLTVENPEMRQIRACQRLHFGVLQTGKSEFQISGVGRIETLHHQESQNREMRNPENSKQAHRPEVRIPGVGGVKSRDSSSQESRSREIRNVETPFVQILDTGRQSDPGGYRGPPTFSKWLKTIFWPFWQFTIFRFSLPGPF